MRGDLAGWSNILLSDIRFGKNTKVMRRQLAQDVPRKVFYRFDQNTKKAFWINIYNAFYIYMSERFGKPAKFLLDRKHITIARHTFSLNDIERDILTGYRSTGISKGYFRKTNIPDVVKKFALSDYDPRVHYALCRSVVDGPEIIPYYNDYIDKQLNYAAGLFLELNIDFDHENKTVVLPMYMKEYYYAIGGKKEIVELVYECMDAEIDDYKFFYKENDKGDDIIRYADDYNLAHFMR